MKIVRQMVCPTYTLGIVFNFFLTCFFSILAWDRHGETKNRQCDRVLLWEGTGGKEDNALLELTLPPSMPYVRSS